MTAVDRLVLSLAASVALALPAVSQATSLYHPTNGEIGYTYHPEHLKSTKTRAEVMAELEAARRDGTLAAYMRNRLPPMKFDGPTKTRAQVSDELRKAIAEERTLTADQRRHEKEQQIGG